MLENSKKGFPNYKELLRLEALAKKEGSGINIDSLVGAWKFSAVWKEGNESKDIISSSTLRLLSATLELRRKQDDNLTMPLTITNSIQIGYLKIKFIGKAKLKGIQPLLLFFFEQFLIQLGSIDLLRREIPLSKTNKWPFFALIAIEPSKECLVARGRGGGIALWNKINKI